MGILENTVAGITVVNSAAMDKAQARLDSLTKPLGSLGRLEELAKRIAGITGKGTPALAGKVIFTFAGDHGVTEEGVSPYPQEVTAQMVYNFIRGGAAINVLSAHAGARVVVADMGVATALDPAQVKSPLFRDRKVGFGTKNFTKGPAMSREDARLAVEAGIILFEEEMHHGIDIAGIGEMGIGNSTSASAIVAVFTGIPVEMLVGRGAGLDDAGVHKKASCVKKGIAVNKPDPKDALDVLSKVGGYEIAGLAGVVLAAANRKVPVVIDGLISTSAALVAAGLAPLSKQYMIASHCSVEPGHIKMLDFLGLRPLFNLDMRLGEGTGAAIAISLCDASIKVLTQMATFQSANVSGRDK